MTLPKLACGLAVVRLGGVAAMGAVGLTGLVAFGLGAAYVLHQRMKQSTEWTEDYRKPITGRPSDPE